MCRRYGQITRFLDGLYLLNCRGCVFVFSQFHLSFKYNHDDSRYECIDLGSRNGTLLNGRRMSNAKQESEAMPVLHGTVIGLSQTRLLCHIHDGHSTCDDCEPHKLLSAAASVAGPAAAAAPTNVPGVAADGTTLTHKQELKQLKKRYGLADESEYVMWWLAKLSSCNDKFRDENVVSK